MNIDFDCEDLNVLLFDLKRRINFYKEIDEIRFKNDIEIRKNIVKKLAKGWLDE